MISAIGELKERIERNKKRLDCEEYSAPKVFELGAAWPGDWQGRALLALCEHYEASNRSDEKVLRQINGIVEALSEHTNAHGYFGPLFDGVTVNEQQVSGNSWFIRGLCDYYRITGEKAYLRAAEKIFALYAENGKTVNYGNFNWFNRPLTWTEPCAFIDSLILASELYFATGKYGYLAFANRVYFNAIATAQRLNDGAGCETCLSEQNDTLKVHMYEAPFCCTMRLANGLNYIRAHAVTQMCGVYVALFAVGGEYESDECKFTYEFDWNSGCVKVNVLRGKADVRLYMPTGVRIADAAHKDGFELLSGLNCGLHEYKAEIELQKEKYKDLTVYFYADRLCTEKQYDFFSPVVFDIDGRKLSPVDGCIFAEEKFGINSYVQKI